MKSINISKAKYRKLVPVEIDSSVYNTEARIFRFEDKGIVKVFKELFFDEGMMFANKLYTLEMIDQARDNIPTDFVLPQELCSVNGQVKGFTMPYINGINLNVFLNDSKVDLKEKIFYLKKIGQLLEHMKMIRRNTDLKSFYINDLHEGNFIIDKKSYDLKVLDVDSIKIADNKPFNSKYLSPVSMFTNTPDKYDYFNVDCNNYYTAGFGYVQPSENSDLYCYNMMILNFLYHGKASHMTIDEYYNYISYLESIGVSQELVNSFLKLMSEGVDNPNPKDLLDSLNEKTLYLSQEKVYKRKNNKIT